MRSKMSQSYNKKEPKNKHMLYLLVFFVISSLVFSVITVYDLDWEDGVSNKRGFLLFLCGMVFFTSLYIALNHITLKTSTGQKLVKHYKLSNGDVFDISNKEVSAVQALFCCITGTTVCTYSCTRDMLRTSHYISEGYAWFGAAYFFYDIWSMYKVHVVKQRENVSANGDGSRYKEPAGINKFFVYLAENAVIVGHHVFIGGFGFLTITYFRGGLGDCFFGFIYLMEASTPFVSARGIISKMGLKNSRVYVVNGIIMLITFFLCRIAMFPYVIYLYSKSINSDFISAVSSLPRGCKTSILILLLPQLYWFMLMINGATKMLKPKAGANNKKKGIKNAH